MDKQDSTKRTTCAHCGREAPVQDPGRKGAARRKWVDIETEPVTIVEIPSYGGLIEISDLIDARAERIHILPTKQATEITVTPSRPLPLGEICPDCWEEKLDDGWDEDEWRTRIMEGST